MAEDIETAIKTTLHWTTRHVNIAIKIFAIQNWLYEIFYVLYKN